MCVCIYEYINVCVYVCVSVCVCVCAQIHHHHGEPSVQILLTSFNHPILSDIAPCQFSR